MGAGNLLLAGQQLQRFLEAEVCLPGLLRQPGQQFVSSTVLRPEFLLLLEIPAERLQLLFQVPEDLLDGPLLVLQKLRQRPRPIVQVPARALQDLALIGEEPVEIVELIFQFRVEMHSDPLKLAPLTLQILPQRLETGIRCFRR